jgi:ABC-type multidrug transport system ATPase subunit
MIDVEGLSKVYPGSGVYEPKALDEVTFQVPERGVFGLLGASGSGKTTVVRILATILIPSAGHARIDGFDVVESPLAVQQSVGYMPAYPGFYPAFTAEEHLDYWGRFYRMPRAERSERAAVILERLDLADDRTTKAKAFSYGMLKRLALAQALLHNPRALILDEPLDGLEPEEIDFFRSTIRELARDGKTVLLSSHVFADVTPICTHLGLLENGQLMAVGTVEDLHERIGTRGALRALVECGEVSAPAMRSLQGLDHVIEVARTEWGIVVTMDADARPEINRVLVSQGVRVIALKLAELTLDDASAALAGGVSRGA